MRAFKLKKCRRVHGLHFAPDGGRLLAVVGVEASGVETAIWLNLAGWAGEPARTLTFLADRFAVAANHARFVICSDAYSRSALPNLIRWLDPREPGGWNAVKVGVGWRAGTTAVTAGPLGLSADGSRLVVAVGRQALGGEVPWTFHLAVCQLCPPGPATMADVDSQVTALAVAPDGANWATSASDRRRGAISLFDNLGAAPLANFTSPRLRAGVMAFAPDGRHLAVVSGRGVILLTADRLAPVGELGGHRGQVNAVAFSPDSRRLLTASHDGAVRVWDGATGEAVQAFDWDIGPVTALAFAPDGLTCAAAGKNGQVVIWDVDG